MRARSVADPDLQIAGGGRSSRPWNKGGGSVSKKFFSALRASFWSKNKGGGPPPRAAGSATDADGPLPQGRPFSDA